MTISILFLFKKSVKPLNVGLLRLKFIESLTYSLSSTSYCRHILFEYTVLKSLGIRGKVNSNNEYSENHRGHYLDRYIIVRAEQF